MSNLQTYYHFKIDFQKVDQNTGGNYRHSIKLNVKDITSNRIYSDIYIKQLSYHRYSNAIYTVEYEWGISLL